MSTTLTDLVGAVPENSIRFLGHEPHTHDVPHLIHVVTGSADITVEGHTVRLRSHENLWLAAEVEHAARYEPGSIVLGPFLSAGTTPPRRAQRVGVVPQITQVMRLVLAAAPCGEDQVRPFRSALDEALRTLGDQRFFALPVPDHPAARAVARRAATRSTLAELAREQCTSPRQIQRVFQAETGLPFRQWRARARLNVAITRLRVGDSLTVAAHVAGYASRASLLKALSRETGIAERALAEHPIEALDNAG